MRIATPEEVALEAQALCPPSFSASADHFPGQPNVSTVLTILCNYRVAPDVLWEAWVFSLQTRGVPNIESPLQDGLLDGHCVPRMDRIDLREAINRIVDKSRETAAPYNRDMNESQKEQYFQVLRDAAVGAFRTLQRLVLAYASSQ